MGDRANIALKHNAGTDQPEEFIYLYSHWEGSFIPSMLQRALVRGKSRWSHDQYLNRIIFNEMTMGRESETTGFGLSVYVVDGGGRIIEVDNDNMTVKVRGGSKVWKFEDFIALKLEDDEIDQWEIASEGAPENEAAT